MTFLQPWWWLLALLAVPLALLHGRRRRRVPVASLRLWREAARAAPRPRPRLRPPVPSLSLFLRLAALLVVVAALAGPRPAGGTVDQHVVVLDRSASMGATSGDGDRLAIAVGRATAELRGLDPRRRGGPGISLLLRGPDAEVSVARADDARPALAALARASAAPAPDAEPWSRTAARAAGLLLPGESARVTVLTDGAEAAAARAAFGAEFAERGPDVRVLAVGDAAASLGLAGVRAVPLDPEEGRWRVEGELIAYPPPEGSVPVAVEYAGDDGGAPLAWDVIDVRVRGPATPFGFEATVPGPGVLALRLPGDALAVDDVARVGLLGAPIPLRVLLAGPTPPALAEALSGLEAAEVVVLPPGADATDAAGVEGPFDLAVATGDARLDPAVARTILWTGGASPAGPLPALPGPPERRGGPLGDGPWSALGDAPPEEFALAYDAPRLAGAEIVLDSDEGPLLQVRSDGGRLDVVAAWDLGAGPWARELGFAAFVAEIGWRSRPGHGRWSIPRCVAGRPCPYAPAGEAYRAVGVHGEGNGRWIVDGAAGAESDLREAGAASPEDAAGAQPGRRADQALAAIAALLLAIDGAVAARPLRAAGGERGGLAIAARGAAIAALAAAAAGVPAPLPSIGERTVVVLDPARWPADPLEAFGSAPRGARALVVVEGDGRVLRGFGDDPEAAARPSAAPVGGDPDAALALAEALLADGGGRVALAGASFPDSPASARRADALAGAGIRVDVLPAPAATPTEARVEAPTAPAVVRSGERFPLEVEVAGPAAAEHAVRVEVDGEVVSESPAPGGRLELELEAGPPGVREVRASLAGGAPAGRAADDAAALLVEVRTAGRLALVASGAPTEGLASLLREAGHDVRTWTPADVPYDLEGLLGTDVVALLDVPAVDLHPRQQEAIGRWVAERGGGVLLAGAERAFGPGGYLRTPLEDLSPLSARVPGERPKAAIAFVIDRSGSMQQTVAGADRLDVAKEATVAAVDLLHEESEIAVVVFDDAATVVLPLGPPAGLREALRPIAPGGGTDLYPALEAAYAELLRSDAEARHIVVMTDGLAQPAAFEPLVERIADSGATVSTVAIGRGADAGFLRSIARLGGGAFHASEDVRALPAILSQEAMLLSADPVREGVVEPALHPGSAAFARDLGPAFPAIGIHVRTTLRPGAEVHASTPAGDPLLASWRHGLGRVVALATPLAGAHADRWAGLPFADRLLPRTFRWLASPVVGPGVHARAARDGDAWIVEATVVAPDGSAVDDARLDVVVDPPGAEEAATWPMAGVGRGRYRARVPAFRMGVYRFRAVPSPPAGPEAPPAGEAVAVTSYPASMASGARGAEGPVALARATGGSVSLNGALAAPAVRWRLGAAPDAGVAPWGLAALALTAVGLAAGADRRSGEGSVFPR